MKISDDENPREQERAEGVAAIDRAREAFQGVAAEEIERETDRIIARNRAAAQTTTDDASTAG
jgi:hypothetical protein